MPVLALWICLAWFLVLFVFRSIVQWRRTGSAGFHGFHGRIGSLPWLAGAAASLGLTAAVVAPFATLFAWPGGALLVESRPLHLAGAALAVAGIAVGLLAQLSMGSSWRIGVDAGERTALVTHGLFAWVRNPIFSAVSLSALGLALLVPSPFALFACGAVLVGIELQVRAVEEPHLERVHGDAYRRYAARVGRFVPGAGRRAHD